MSWSREEEAAQRSELLADELWRMNREKVHEAVAVLEDVLRAKAEDMGLSWEAAVRRLRVHLHREVDGLYPDLSGMPGDLPPKR